MGKVEKGDDVGRNEIGKEEKHMKKGWSRKVEEERCEKQEASGERKANI